MSSCSKFVQVHMCDLLCPVCQDSSNLKCKSQIQISKTNLKYKSQMQISNASPKCKSQMQRSDSQNTWQCRKARIDDWFRGCTIYNQVGDLFDGMSFLSFLSRRLTSEMQDKIRGISGKQGQAVLQECSNYVPCQPLACALGEIINYGIITCRLLSAADQQRPGNHLVKPDYHEN